jgi:hypothetical protein
MLKQAGICLVIILVFMQFFALLSIYIMQMNSWEIKMNTAFYQKFQLRLNAMRILSQIENANVTQWDLCYVPLVANSILVDQPLSWWQSHIACTGYYARVQYYYIIEILGLDPCATIFFKKDKVAKYFRISLLLQSQVGNKAKLIIQSILVKPSKSELMCQGPVYLVNNGRQSWHELAST